MHNAVIDLGSNTFHLIIANEKQEIILKDTKVVQLGKGGISKNIITPEAAARATTALISFKETISKYSIPPENIYAMGTSALRNATNGTAFAQEIAQKTGIKINIIDGNKEAEFIYKGVTRAIDIKNNTLICDIGGGSVEFIICDSHKVLWKQSFEIGGIRLMEQFMKTDPIDMAEIDKMENYFREKLLPLENAVYQYKPSTLIGSSGTFDTLKQIYLEFKGEENKEVGIDYPIDEFIRIYEQLIIKDRESRLNIPGMIEMRVDMIVVATILVSYLIRNFQIKDIGISKFSLKEGVIASLCI